MNICHRTHIGLKRPTNQDSLLIEEHLFAVADGMGGHKGGETASRMTVDILSRMLREKEPDEALLRQAIDAANRRVRETGKDDSNLTGMGTTMTLLWENPERVIVAQIGDSRAYLLRNGELRQITEDHSVVAELVRKHLITPKMALESPYRNVITRAVGTDASVDADFFEEKPLPGDLWLLCSDGLTNMVTDELLQKVLTESESDETAADELLRLALENGGTDNITFLLARVPEEARK